MRRSQLLLQWTFPCTGHSLYSVVCSGIHSAENPQILEHPLDNYVGDNEPTKLECKVEGDPKPTVTWYRNGEKVSTSADDHSSHRLVIKEHGRDGLFFLRIIQNSNISDIGTYYCNATNIHGSAISRTAFIHKSVSRWEDKVDRALTLCCRDRDKAVLHLMNLF
ncbi:roundabout-like protein 2 [Plakobranchus ocellatus]|uniref:Roundabout-like protein 2 n=1 Tax=Plakobranchus ocellatus TaxID=259542 RepID=A0AAV4DUH3_9GAST|nr:roundabout-like protein 2 [Plakobranchus ocellatus]